MAQDSGRYSVLPEATYTMPNKQEVTYKARRFLPQGDNIPVLTTIPLRPGDRLDVLAAANLGDPEQFWQICDANNAMNPFDLLDAADTLRIPIPQSPEAL